jgi:hypothetical protein
MRIYNLSVEEKTRVGVGDEGKEQKMRNFCDLIDFLLISPSSLLACFRIF